MGTLESELIKMMGKQDQKEMYKSMLKHHKQKVVDLKAKLLEVKSADKKRVIQDSLSVHYTKIREYKDKLGYTK